LPVSVIVFSCIEAKNHDEAMDKTLKKAELIVDLLNLYKETPAVIFGLASQEINKGIKFKTHPPVFVRRRMEISDDLSKIIPLFIAEIKRDIRLDLYVRLFAEANRETNVHFAIVKFWSLLETMASEYKGRTKEERVRKLYEDYEIYLDKTKYDGHDYIALANKHRNAIVHSGTSNPELMTPKYRKKYEYWMSISNSKINEILDDFRADSAFLIRRYIFRRLNAERSS